MGQQTDKRDGTGQVDVRTRRWGVSLVWIVPIVAVLVGISLVIHSVMQPGPTIVLNFKTGSGLVANKTEVKYRNVVIGQVSEVELSQDQKSVTATIKLVKQAENFTRQLGDSIEGLRIGVPAQFFADGLADDVRTAIDAALKEYEKLGATLVPVQLPRTQLSVPAYYIISPAEASSNLSRFDGVRYGHRTANPLDLQDLYKKSRAEAFGDEVQRRIMIGAYVLSEGYYDAYYLQAQKIRRLIANDFQAAFKDCDVIAGPVAPSVAWQLGDKADPLASYLADVFTLPASLAGLPAMSLPVGWGAHQMPVGLQLIGNYLQEGRLLNVAHRFQQVTDFHQAEPKSI